MGDKRRVLILCTGNSARSQMAEGLLRELGGVRFEVESAGTRPGGVRPEAVEAMREVGVDISSHRSKSVDEFAGREFDYVITVCDNAAANCPVFPGKAERVHHGFVHGRDALFLVIEGHADGQLRAGDFGRRQGFFSCGKAISRPAPATVVPTVGSGTRPNRARA